MKVDMVVCQSDTSVKSKTHAAHVDEYDLEEQRVRLRLHKLRDSHTLAGNWFLGTTDYVDVDIRGDHNAVDAQQERILAAYSKTRDVDSGCSYVDGVQTLATE
ncbi:hypothetical protein HDU99_009351, partial [Rhizoclosmatium hyalinum]